MACKILCMNKSKTPFRGTCKSENLRKLKKKTFEDSKSKILQKKIVLIIWHPKSFRKKSFEGYDLRLCLDGCTVPGGTVVKSCSWERFGWIGSKGREE